MKSKMLSITIMVWLPLFCCGQSFLSKYPKLTKKNLSEFFVDWEAYSDSIDSNNVIGDSILAQVICMEYIDFYLESRINRPRYVVLPQKIKVERYYTNVDTLMAKMDGFPCDVKEEQCNVDSITPFLPFRGLYLTGDIETTLSSFAGGGDTPFNIGSIRKLKKYIPYGHRSDCWLFMSFPLIIRICYTNNLIAIMRMVGYYSGDVIWYVKESGKFVRREQPVIMWIE